MASRNWTIVKESRFEKEITQVLKTEKRADEFVAGIEWQLSRNPMHGQQVPNAPDVWAIPLHKPVWMKASMVAYYTIDEKQESVYLLSLAVFEDNDL